MAKVEIREGAGDASPGTPLDESGDNNKQVNYHMNYITSPALNLSGHSSSMRLADELLAEESKIRAHNNEVRRINYHTCPKGSSDPDRYAVNKSPQETISTVDKNSRSKIPEKMVHICDNSKNDGINFERTPTRAERRNTIGMIRRLIRKHEKSKGKLKTKKGKSHSDYIDNPNLSQALLSNNADDWIKAINAEMKQIRAEEVYEAVLRTPYGKPWVRSHMSKTKIWRW